MDAQAVATLVQAGGVGIALVSLWIIYQMTKIQAHAQELLTNTLNKIAEEHRQTIDRNTDAWTANTGVLAKLNERIK